VTDYRFPTSAALLQSRFAKYQGTTVQLSDIGLDVLERVPGRAYTDVLYGSMFSVAGVASTTAYSGIGFSALDNRLCQSYQGSVNCPAAWTRLWLAPDGYSAPLADLLRARTVVVQNSLVDTRHRTPPPGWHRTPAAETSGLATVWTRDRALPWPGGRLSYAPPGVRVLADTMTGQVGEHLTYRRTGTGPAALTFARLAWPGYTATVDGRPTTVRPGPFGLLVVDLPAGPRAGAVELSWHPPGWRVSWVAFGLGLALTAGLGVWCRRRVRRG
jgi:hypothetical protein